VAIITTIIMLSGIMSCGLFQSKYYNPQAPFTGIMGDIKKLEQILLQQKHKQNVFF
jgi:hypothetical protein